MNAHFVLRIKADEFFYDKLKLSLLFTCFVSSFVNCVYRLRKL